MEFTNLVLIATIVGVVELVKRAYDKDYKSALLIAVAGVAGALFAPFAGESSWFIGMLYGFSASGVVTAVTRVGGLK